MWKEDKTGRLIDIQRNLVSTKTVYRDASVYDFYRKDDPNCEPKIRFSALPVSGRELSDQEKLDSYPHRFHIEWHVWDDSGSLHDGRLIGDRRTVIEEYLTALAGMTAGYGYVDRVPVSATASVRFDAPAKGL